MSMYGYDPARVLALRTQTVRAIESLGAIRSDEPAAASAVRVVRLTRQNLEESWMPLLGAITTSTAMSTWRSHGALAPEALAEAVSSIVATFDAVSRWVATAGMDDLSDVDVLARLADATGELAAGVQRTGDVDVSLQRFDRLLGEVARRTRAGGDDFAQLAWGRLGPAGVAGLLDAVSELEEVHDMGLMTGNERTRRLIRNGLGVLLAAMVIAAPACTDVLTSRVTVSGLVLDLAVRPTAPFPSSALVALAERAVLYATANDSIGRPPVIDIVPETNRVLAEIADHPATATLFLVNPAVLRAVATSAEFDGTVVEDVLVAGAAAPLHHESLERVQLLRGLVDVSAHGELSTGGRRGGARVFGSYLEDIGYLLDQRFDVQAVVEDEVVRLGSYDDVSRFVGQVIDDEQAQLTLGTLIGTFRADALAAFTHTVRAQPELSPDAVSEYLASDLADVTNVISLVTAARRDRNELLSLRHGLAGSTTSEVLSLLATASSWAIPSTMPLTRQLVGVATRSVSEALGATAPRSVPSVGVDRDLAANFTIAVVGLPASDVTIRERLGLDRVSELRWERISRLIAQIESETDLDARDRAHSELLHEVERSPALDTYLATIRNAAGETLLATAE